jgi:hypothetical protein
MLRSSTIRTIHTGMSLSEEEKRLANAHADKASDSARTDTTDQHRHHGHRGGNTNHPLGADPDATEVDFEFGWFDHARLSI